MKRESNLGVLFLAYMYADVNHYKFINYYMIFCIVMTFLCRIIESFLDKE